MIISDISTNFILEIDIGDIDQDEILKVINTTITNYITNTLSIDSSYDLEFDVVSDENGKLTVNILVISSDAIPINEKEIIDETESNLNDKFGEGAANVIDNISTTEASESAPKGESHTIVITIGCICAVLVTILIIYGFYRYKKNQAKSQIEEKGIELAIDSPSTPNNEINGTGTRADGYDFGEGTGSNKTGHRSTQSDQLYEPNTISTPSGDMDNDNGDNHATPGMHTNDLDLAEDDGEDIEDDEESLDNNKMYDKNNVVTKGRNNNDEGDSETNSNDEMYGSSEKATKGNENDSDVNDDAMYDTANNNTRQ